MWKKVISARMVSDVERHAATLGRAQRGQGMVTRGWARLTRCGESGQDGLN
jgi:hypothetical protein